MSNWIIDLYSTSTESNEMPIAVDSSGSVAVGLSSTQNATYNGHVVLYDSNGNLQWQRYWGDTLNATTEINRQIAFNGNGDVVVVNNNPSYNTVEHYVTAFTSSGTTRFSKQTTQLTDNYYGVGLVCDPATEKIFIHTCSGSGDLLSSVISSSGSGLGGRSYYVGTGGSNYSYSSNADFDIPPGTSSYLYSITSLNSQSLARLGIISRYAKSTTSTFTPNFRVINSVDDWCRITIDQDENLYVAATDSPKIMKITAAGSIDWQFQITYSTLVSMQLSDIHTNGTFLYALVSGTTSAGVTSPYILCFDLNGNLQWERQLLKGSDSLYIGSGRLVSTVTDIHFTALDGTNNRVVISKLPNDGSSTGTFGSYTWSSTNYFTTSVTTISLTTRSFGGSSAITRSFNDLTAQGTSSLTSSLTSLPSTLTGAADLFVTASVSADAEVSSFVTGAADLFVTATTDQLGVVTYVSQSEPYVTASVSVSAEKVLSSSADLTVTATTDQSANIEYAGAADLTVFASVSADAQVPGIQIGASDLTVSATVQADCDILASAAINITGFAAVAADAVMIVSGQSDFTVTADLQADAQVGSTVIGASSLSVITTVNALGQVFSLGIDEYTTLVVPSETRQIKTLPETRVSGVKSETRVNMIL